MKKLVILLVALPFISFAQQTLVKGYIVQMNGDTVRGDVKINPKKEFELFSKVAFVEPNGMQRIYKADKIRSYSYDGKVFTAVKNDGESVFYKTLSQGALDLFELRYEVLLMNELKVKNEYFMRKKGSDEYVKIKHGRFKKQLAEEMSDNSRLVKELEENKKIELENMIDVFNQYNTWAKSNKS
jgi:hypothetical protein